MADLLRRERLQQLISPQKVASPASAPAKRFGVSAADGLVPDHMTLGDVDSAEAPAEYEAGKRAHKAELPAARAAAG